MFLHSTYSVFDIHKYYHAMGKLTQIKKSKEATKVSEKYFSLFNTKGTQKGVLSLENPGYYENGVIEIKPETQKGQNPFINRVQKANSEFAELTIDELEILGEVESHRDMTVFDVNKAHVELRMPLALILEMQKRGKFVIDNDGYYYYSPEKTSECFSTLPTPFSIFTSIIMQWVN